MADEEEVIPQKYVVTDGAGRPIAFYSSEIHGENIPAEAVPISQEDWQDLVDNQGRRKVIDGEIVEASLPFTTGQLSAYRDKVRFGVVSYNGIEAENTDENRNTVVSIINFILTLPLENRDIQIDWKGPNQWHSAALSDFQGLVLVGGLQTQKAFTAQKTVLAQHDTTPYKNWDDAKAAFDAAMAA